MIVMSTAGIDLGAGSTPGALTGVGADSPAGAAGAAVNPPARSVGEESTATIYADFEREDRILAGLTFRQLAIVVPVVGVVWLAYLTVGARLPLPVFAAQAIAVIAVAAVLALGERDGVRLERLLVYALRQRRRPRRLVPAGEHLPASPWWPADRRDPAMSPAGPAGADGLAGADGVAPLRLPVRAIGPDGVLDLGEQGVAVLVGCSTVSFALRTRSEQIALTAAYGRWLNSLAGPVQILLYAAPVNLTPVITALKQRAAGLPDPALARAAGEHARFLADLAATKDLRSRRVLLVIREPATTAGDTMTGPILGSFLRRRTPPGARAADHRTDRRTDVRGAAGRARQRAEQAARALAAAGIIAQVLDARHATAALARLTDPTAPPLSDQAAAPGQAITAHVPAGPPAGQAVGSAAHHAEGRI